MNIYFLGSRAHLFEEQLKDYGHKVTLIKSHKEVKKCDVCLVSGCYEIIPEEYLNIPKYGFVGFHETDLPKGRGCAPINWTLINGKKKLVICAFKIVKGMDEGEILRDFVYKIKNGDTCDDLRNQANNVIAELLDVFFNSAYDVDCLFGTAFCNAKKQTGRPTYYRKRHAEDSRIDIDKPIKGQWNLIRSCSDKEGYPAFFEIYDRKFKIVPMEVKNENIGN